MVKKLELESQTLKSFKKLDDLNQKYRQILDKYKSDMADLSAENLALSFKIEELEKERDKLQQYVSVEIPATMQALQVEHNKGVNQLKEQLCEDLAKGVDLSPKAFSYIIEEYTRESKSFSGNELLQKMEKVFELMVLFQALTDAKGGKRKLKLVVVAE